MMRRIIFIGLILGFCLMVINLEAAEPKVFIRYFENLSGGIRLVSPDLKEEMSGPDIDFNVEVPKGWTILTENGDFIELELVPGGTIIKISENTNFRVENLQGVNNAASSEFSLTFGKFRAIVAKATGQDQFAFKGQGATCGVRGTDFGMEVGEDENGINEDAFVFKGQIDYTQHTTGKKIPVSAGQMANPWAKQFQSVEIPKAKMDSLLKNLDFKKLVAKNQTPPDQEKDKEKDKAKDKNKTTDAVANPTDTQQQPTEQEKDKLVAQAQAGVLDWLFKIVGLEIGSITINDTTYAKAVLTPTFKFGKLAFSLYLPMIYTNDMFNPNNWYFPKGNNEWSFGTDHSNEGLDVIMLDAAKDLFLKIRYIEWGEQRDPFFFKLGNLNDMSIGHGILMHNYANDADFPSIRRLGINLGIGLDNFGLESVVNDVLEPEIFGGRIAYKPLGKAFPMAIGLSSILDISPAGDLDEPTRTSMGDPMLINTALDIDFPIIENEALGLVFFADGAAVLPYFRTNGTGSYANVTAGAAFNSILTNQGLKNYGAVTGAFGNVGPLDWRCELRYSTGTFKPYAIDGNYDRLRPQYAKAAAEFAQNPTDPIYNESVIGVYGEGGYTLENVFSLTLGYHWPLAISDSGIQSADDDYLHVEAVLFQGVIPGIKLGINLSYDRYRLVPFLSDLFDNDVNTYGLLDAYSQFKTSAVYGITDNMDLLLTWTTVAARDASGNITFDSNLLPKLETSLAIETQLHF